ncbi:unnamed protein product [Parajaminaea phylloscopi]
MFALHKAFEQSTQSVHEAAQAERERRTKLTQDAHDALKADITSHSVLTDQRNRQGPPPPITEGILLNGHSRSVTSESSSFAYTKGDAPSLAPVHMYPGSPSLQPHQAAHHSSSSRPATSPLQHPQRRPHPPSAPGARPRGPAPSGHSSRHALHKSLHEQPYPALQPLSPPPSGDLPPVPISQSSQQSTPRAEGWVPPPGSIVRTPRRRSSRPGPSQPGSPAGTLPPTPVLPASEETRKRREARSGEGASEGTAIRPTPTIRLAPSPPVLQQPQLTTDARKMSASDESPATPVIAILPKDSSPQDTPRQPTAASVLPSHDPIVANTGRVTGAPSATNERAGSSTASTLPSNVGDTESVRPSTDSTHGQPPQTAPVTTSSRFRIPKAIGRRKNSRQTESRGSEASSAALSSSPEWMDPVGAARRGLQSSSPQVTFASGSADNRSSSDGRHGLAINYSGSAQGFEPRKSPTQSFSALAPLSTTAVQSVQAKGLPGTPNSTSSSFKRRSLAFFSAALPAATTSRETVNTSRSGTAAGSPRSSFANSSREQLNGQDSLYGRAVAQSRTRLSESSSRVSEGSGPSAPNSAVLGSNEIGRPSISSSGDHRDGASQLDVATADTKAALSTGGSGSGQGSASASASASASISQDSAQSSQVNLLGKTHFRNPFSAQQARDAWNPPSLPVASPGTMMPAESYMVAQLHESTESNSRPQASASPWTIRSQSSSNLRGQYGSSDEPMMKSADPSQRDREAVSRPGTALAWVDGKTPERGSNASRLMRGLSHRRPRTSGGTTSRTSSPDAPRDGSPRRINSSTTSIDRPATASASGASTPGAPGSRLDVTGGAAALFGGNAGASRPRASSLLPSLSIFSRKPSAAESGHLQQGPHSRGPSGQLVPPQSSLGHSAVAEGGPKSAPSEAPEDSSQAGSAAVAVVKATPKYPPMADETPASYAARIEMTVERSEVSTVLASQPDDFFADALHCHMQKFLFADNPLDIALRKMLMDLRLPKETQQIDRVMEAFAKRYNECNEGLFASEDQPYILAFSLMMLHTDAFNKNAKNKMSKVDYVKNTASSGVPQDVLEYLYDNLTFTQFVYSDEAQSAHSGGLRSMTSNRSVSSGSSASAATAGFFASMTSSSGSSRDKNNKIDAYLIIRQGRLNQLRPNIESVIPEDDPFSFTGTDISLDVPGLARAYMSAPSIEVGVTKRPSISGPLPGDGLSGSTASSQGWAGPELMGSDLGSSPQDMDSTVTLRVFKVGIVNRKDEVTEKGKKASRKWKPSGMILTSSQLLFFRDLVWIDALQAQINEQLAAATPEDRKRGIIVTPKITNLRPDGLLSLGDAIALKDDTYDRHQSVLRLVGMQGSSQHEYLFQARDDTDMNEWIAGINFCACFRSAGIRVTNLDALALTNAVSSTASSPSGTTNSGRQQVSYSRSLGSGELDPPWMPSDSLHQTSPFNDGRGYNTSVAGLLTPAPHAQTSASVAVHVLRERVAIRQRELAPKVEAVHRALGANTLELQELLRLARQFALMTPFQRATRERIEAAATPLAARIRQLRIAVAKFECRYSILTAEMQAGDRVADVGIASAGGGGVSSPSMLLAVGRLPERKGSYFLPEGPEDGLAGSTASLLGSRHDSVTGSLRPVSEASEGDANSPATPATPSMDSTGVFGVSIGSFAAPFPDKGGLAGGADGGSRSESSSVTGALPSSLRLRVRTKSNKGGSDAGTPSQSEVAESWNSTRAFRDPDRISVAQLPSIETIEAATREKARRRVNGHQNQANKRSLVAYGSTMGGGASGNGTGHGGHGHGGGRGAKAAAAAASSGRAMSASSSSRRGGPSSGLGGGYSGVGSTGSGSGSARDEIPVQDRAADPPVFMTTWGV